MKLQNVVCVAVALMIPGTVWAYGESGGGSGLIACTAKFSKFSPSNNTEVEAQSEFSFFASPSTNPTSIRVTIKDQLVPLTVTAKHDGLYITGKLPAAVKGTFAKIYLAGKGPNQCEASGSWLVKVK